MNFASMRFAKTLCIAAAVIVAGFSTAFAQTIKIGSKNFTEQFIVAELYAAALENAGFKVERKINLGGTLVAHEALKSGAIDLYPEYTGTGFNAVMKATTTESDPAKVLGLVKAYYEKEFNLTWLKPSRINNGYAIVVRPDTAKEHNLKTLSDLGKVAKKLSLGAGTEFVDRRDGIAGLKEVYGAEFGEFKQFAALRLRYEALSQKQVDVANGFSTDWQIAAEKFVALDDDKSLFPPYFLAPVVRPEIAANAKIVEALEKVGDVLDNPTMQELNRQVEVDKKEPRTVAANFLKAKGLVR
ncbi:glycine betaine ABC transporter substrate-binding protein [Bosea sp. (in: a-proteobacteria)]|jgi:osmoprotectant transport system substrate-binding protein|uniref:glycine betaine ABC transporter substrate-binding protein n=1 Tax=Bosea sp. (in: a-proteobacteria) TaxID=1871050 RepID=UPI003F706CEC